ncbi:MAG TPA: radical SAM family heme chaperone HemW [Acidobacteriota bacterium]|nr:radical SAM family heme chaperone HemW [Acidobacteriota bacterium]
MRKCEVNLAHRDNPQSAIGNPQLEEIALRKCDVNLAHRDNPQPAIRNPQLEDSPIGIYIHLPFCTTKCNYCDFATAPYEEAIAKRYLSALVQEIEQSDLDSKLHTVDTIYFGGGTPSLVPEYFIESTLNVLAARFSIQSEPEITLEMNPSARESGRTRSYRSLGINRLSIGVQSFDDRELTAMTRAHSADEARRAVIQARDSGFDNTSLDLILGLPRQTAATFGHSLKTAASLPIQHLSIYILELHSGTPLHSEVSSRRTRLPSDDFVARQYLRLVPSLEAQGLLQYEVSNFARRGFQSRHNWKYWTRQPYIGFGVSSHSFDGARRWNNTRSLAHYLREVEAGKSPCEQENVVGDTDSVREQLFLGLRTCRGVPADVFNAFSRGNERLLGRWNSFRAHGWLEKSRGRYRLTTKGYLVSNEILSELM